jgi:FkbH-like protein
MIFQVDFSRHFPEHVDAQAAAIPSDLATDNVSDLWFLRWEEHCVECAAPQCFSTCALYSERADGMCARFEDGITPNYRYPGALPYGAEIRFKRWGKLEADLRFAFRSDPRSLARLEHRDRRLARAARRLAPALSEIWPAGKSGTYRLANKWRNRSLERAAALRSMNTAPDELYLEIVNLDATAVTMILELAVEGIVRYRSAIPLKPGQNRHRIPFASFRLSPASIFGQAALLRMSPEADAAAHIVVRWLTFLRRVAAAQAATPGPSVGQRTADCTAIPAPKVKAVVWDLDNTVWAGVLGEMRDGEAQVDPRVLTLIRQLDSRGILQSVASKNDHEHAWDALQRLGLAEFMLFPQINWNPKSASLQTIAAELNIGIDAFAFVDDSVFERSEVASALPQVRVFDVADLDGLMDRPEFDVPITLDAQRRRKLYRVEETRKAAASAFAGDYTAFLRDCALLTTVYPPNSTQERERCFELIQRTNQLNASGRRYSPEEFGALLEDRSRLSLSISCADRFGDYGLVGFMSVAFAEEIATVEDFVLSCRVAQKRVENAVFAALLREVERLGRRQLVLRFVPSARNGIMRDSLAAIGFPIDTESSVPQLLTIRVSHSVPQSDLVALRGLPRKAAPPLPVAANQQTG